METNWVPELTPEEIYGITKYKRAAEQLRELARRGIPAQRKRDNTVGVLRMHTMPGGSAPVAKPELKSSRR
jgi:hypothetical protein